MTNKVVIAKAGFDATKETNPDNLIFSSDYNTLKYYIEGHTTMNWSKGATTNIVTIAHNLGYIPYFVAYVQQGGGTLYNRVPRNNNTAGVIDYADVYADATNLYLMYHFEHFSDTGSGTLDFYYKIFKNNLGL